MALGSTSTITVANPGWGDKREVRIGSPSASWGVGRTGRFSAIIAAREAWLMGVDDWLGLWVRWDHPTMGTWGGIVEDTHITLRSGEFELSCASFHNLIARRRTYPTYAPICAPPGALVHRVVTESDNDTRLGFDSIVTEDDGANVEVELRGDDVQRFVSSMARTADMEWDVTVDDDNWTVDFEFRKRVGQSRPDVMLAEGYQIIDGTFTPSRSTLVNDIYAVSADSEWSGAPGVVVTDPDSIETYHGRFQTTTRYAGASSVATLRALAQGDIDRASEPIIPASIRIADRESQLADVRQGDTIRVVSASANAEYWFRVQQRAVNTDSGTATLVGDCEAVD